MLSDVFQMYQDRYEKILAHMYPAKHSTGFPERNLSVNFAWAYEKTAEARGEDCVSWFEMQFGERNNCHADAVILNLTTRDLLIVEAKRFSHPNAKSREIGEDIARIHQLVGELKTEDRLDMKAVRRCIGVILADVWTETNLKRLILRSYEAGQREPDSEEAFVRRYFPDWTLPGLQDDVRDIAALENYFLLSFLWKVEKCAL